MENTLSIDTMTEESDAISLDVSDVEPNLLILERGTEAKLFQQELKDWQEAEKTQERAPEEENSSSTMAALQQTLEHTYGQKLQIESVSYGERREQVNGQAIHFEGGKEMAVEGRDELFQSLMENKSIAYEEHLAGSYVISDTINEQGERIIKYALVQFEKVPAGKSMPFMDEGYDYNNAIRPEVELTTKELPVATAETSKEKPWSLLDLFAAIAGKQEQPSLAADQSATQLPEKPLPFLLFETPNQPLAESTPLAPMKQNAAPNVGNYEPIAPNPSFEHTYYAPQPYPENAPVQYNNERTFATEMPVGTSAVEEIMVQQQIPVAEIFHPTPPAKELPVFETKHTETLESQNSLPPENKPAPAYRNAALANEIAPLYKEAQYIDAKPSYFSPTPAEKAAVARETINSTPQIYEINDTAAEYGKPPLPLEPLAPSHPKSESSPLPVESLEISSPAEKVFAPPPASEAVKEKYTKPSAPRQESVPLTIESPYIATNAETIIAAVETHLQPVAAIQFAPAIQQEPETFLMLVEPVLAQEITAAIEQVQNSIEPSKVVIAPRPGELALDSALIVGGHSEKVTLELFLAEETNRPTAAEKIIQKETAAPVIIKEAPNQSARVIEISLAAVPEDLSPQKIRDSRPLSQPVEPLNTQSPAEQGQTTGQKSAIPNTNEDTEVPVPYKHSQVIEAALPRRQADRLVISPSVGEDKTNLRKKAALEKVEIADRQPEPPHPRQRTQIPFTTLPTTNLGPRQQPRTAAQRAAQAA